MYALRRVFFDGSDRPELVLLHYAAGVEGQAAQGASHSTLVMTPTEEPGRREARIYLPEPTAGKVCRLRYFFSAVRQGAEWFSPAYQVDAPGDEVRDDLERIEEEGEGNLRPAPGLGTFRLLLPLRDGEPPTGTVRYGFGAMRKKPSTALCRAALPLSGRPPIVEVPEALSVLKDRPMPFFLYHVCPVTGRLNSDKINCARLTFKDEAGEVVCARLLWGGPHWIAQNLSMMEVRNFRSTAGRASEEYFSPDREAYLQARWSGIERSAAPRTFEAFVYGPEGSIVEYCFLVVLRHPDGSTSTAWRNKSGANWSVTL